MQDRHFPQKCATLGFSSLRSLFADCRRSDITIRCRWATLTLHPGTEWAISSVMWMNLYWLQVPQLRAQHDTHTQRAKMSGQGTERIGCIHRNIVSFENRSGEGSSWSRDQEAGGQRSSEDLPRQTAALVPSQTRASLCTSRTNTPSSELRQGPSHLCSPCVRQRWG